MKVFHISIYGLGEPVCHLIAYVSVTNQSTTVSVSSPIDTHVCCNGTTKAGLYNRMSPLVGSICLSHSAPHLRVISSSQVLRSVVTARSCSPRRHAEASPLLPPVNTQLRIDFANCRVHLCILRSLLHDHMYLNLGAVLHSLYR